VVIQIIKDRSVYFVINGGLGWERGRSLRRSGVLGSQVDLVEVSRYSRKIGGKHEEAQKLFK
jgi:hypothetical protein